MNSKDEEKKQLQDSLNELNNQEVDRLKTSIQVII